MGRIRGKDIKGVAFDLYEAYEEKFSGDFEHNKKSLDDLKIFDTKRRKNRVAGYLVRIARRRKR